MTLTPVAGTYLVWFAGSINNNTNNTGMNVSIYAGGTQVAASEQAYLSARVSQDIPFSAIAMVTVNGAEAIEGRWRVDSNTGTMHQRTLMILQVA
jgi:hypothetical protein